WVASESCSLSTGVLYTFNMTVHGYSVSGWAGVKGQSPCPIISYTFPQSSQAAAGTGFGLYAGGYKVLFDDVQVTTVSPSITASGFSNSFIQNGAPGPVGVNTWLVTTRQPGVGWETSPNWLPASQWSEAIASQNYGGSPWGTITGWPDNNAQWIWWDANSDVS